MTKFVKKQSLQPASKSELARLREVTRAWLEESVLKEPVEDIAPMLPEASKTARERSYTCPIAQTCVNHGRGAMVGTHTMALYDTPEVPRDIGIRARHITDYLTLPPDVTRFVNPVDEGHYPDLAPETQKWDP